MPLLDIITKGATDVGLTLRMADSGDGTPETGVTSATGGLDVWYRRQGAAKTSLTESDLSALTDAHSDGGLLHISDGEYRVDFPDAAFATGVDWVDVGWGATGMVGFGGRIRLTSATRGLAGTALPDAAAGAAGGLPTDSAGKTSFNDIAATAVVSGGAITTSGGAVSTVTTTTTATNLTNAPSNGDLTATMKTSVETAVNAQIEANHLDHLFKTTYDPASKPGAADALLNELIESDAGVSRYTANALEQAPTGGSAPTVGQIADAVWEEAIADHSGTAGSVAEQLAAAGAAGDPWATALPGAYSAGQAGKIVGDNLNATVSSRSSQTSVDDVPTVAEFEARTLVAANYFDAAADSVTVGTNNDKTGYSLTAGTGLGNQTANITGNLSGSVGSVTAGVTLANGAHGGSSAVLTLERAIIASTTSNQPGLKVSGNGTGAGIETTGGATAHGLECKGGATSGDGLHAHSQGSGAGAHFEAHGADDSYPGLHCIGDGTGAGIHAEGGAGGVDIDGNIQGNLSGTVGGVAGTITTLDALDTAQDSQHSTTQAAVGTVDTVVDAIKVITDALGATAAARLKLSAETMVTGTVNDANTTPTTTTFAASDITEATADHFNGRIVIFTSGALANQASDITDYALTSGEGVFTVTALTEAPADGVTFIIV